MKKTLLITLAVVVTVITILLGVFALGYNGLVKADEKVKEASSNIGTQLQRRADLIPNFVNTVKGYTEYEQSTLTAVTEARAAVGKAASVSEIEEAEQTLDKAVSVWVNAVTEAYPDLKANTQFIALQDELAGTENRILAARKDYNEKAKNYNLKVRSFPSNIFAGMFGFETVEYFKESEAASEVPTVNF